MPSRSTYSQPTSLLLVHGAGSGPWAFDGWADSFPGLGVAAPDLHEGLDVARASMRDYAERVVTASRSLGRPLVLCGWSMGGLVAMMATPQLDPEALILIEASAPGEVQGFDLRVEPRPGAFDSELAYGPFPAGVRSRPESQYARDERKRGIAVPVLPSRTLVIAGRDFPGERGRALAERYGVQLEEFPALGHWDLVRSPSVREAIHRFLSTPT